MKLKLKNFRCYLEKEFDFGSDGLVLLSGPSGSGKCMGVDTPILLHDGTIKKVQDIQIGDLVMGDDSQPREVLTLATGRDDMYKIVPSKGRPYIVNSAHILTLMGSKPYLEYIKISGKWVAKWMENCRICSKDFDSEQEGKNFIELLPKNPVFDISISEFLKLPKSHQRNNYTFHKGVEFSEKQIPIDPYLLGLWLGDRTSKETDPEIEKLNLRNNKHIPLVYKTNSRKNRLKLLAGLIDTVGCVYKDNIEIVEKDYQLAMDIEYLALSLGFMATFTEVQESVNCYRVNIFGENLDEIPGREKWISIVQNKPANVQEFTISHLGKDQYYGFELVGNNSRFLLGDFTVTHNSTVMMAIMFVLYGEGNKLTTFGKTSCQVEMEFDDLTIVRTKRPNRVVVTNTRTNEEFEDDAGQGIINERFGTAFEVTSYVQQNAFNSFIMMSPLEKLAFLEKFAFHGVDLSQVKGRCQALIKKRNEELITATSQLEMASDYYKTLVKPVRVPFPIKTNNRENAMKNEVVRLKNCKILIKRAEKHLQTLTEELTDTKVYKSQTVNKKEMIDSLKEKIEQCDLDKRTTFYEGDERLSQYETELKIFLSRKELIVLKDRYEQDKIRLENMQENELKEIRKEIDIIEGSLWKEYSAEEVAKTISEYQQLIRDAEKLERLKESKEKYSVNEEKHQENKETLEKSREVLSEKKELLSKLVIQQESYECPSCHVSLRFQDDELHLYKDKMPESDISIDEVKKQISQLSKTINKLEYIVPEEESKLKRYKEVLAEIEEIEKQYEEEIPSKDEAETTIEYMKEYKRAQGELDKKRKRLESNIRDKVFSSSLEMFKDQLCKQKEHIKNIESSLKEEKPLEIDEEELRHSIQIQKQNKEKILGYEKQLKTLSKELNVATESLDEIESKFKRKYSEIRDIDNIELEISGKTEEIDQLKSKAQVHESNVVKIEEYKKYKEELDRYTEWSVKVKDLTELEETNRKRYAAATLLKDKILEAESLAILNVINSINVHAQEYLDIFFPTDPIVVRLLPFKTTKKKTNKPQVNLEIDYKGMEADINMLSGGELARVVLAYTLALAEIFNSPMIMLDESTASLDQDMTSIVMDGIRKNFGNKLTVIIAHQVISGDFDRQISL